MVKKILIIKSLTKEPSPTLPHSLGQDETPLDVKNSNNSANGPDVSNDKENMFLKEINDFFVDEDDEISIGGLSLHKGEDGPFVEPLSIILGMGFEKDKAIDALNKYDNNVEKAANYLVDSNKKK